MVSLIRVDKKRAIKRKWIDREYHVQDNTDVEQKRVKIICNTNQFPVLPFCVSHPKRHGSRGLIKHYHLRFDPKIGYGVFEICRIQCDFVLCISMFDQLCIYDISSKKQECY